MSSGALAYGCCSRFGSGPGGLAPHAQVLAVWAYSIAAEPRARRRRWGRRFRLPTLHTEPRPSGSVLPIYCANVISSSLDPDSMAQALGSGHPDIVALKVHGQHVLMRGRRFRGDLCHLTRRVPNQHFRLVCIQRGTVHGPAFAVQVSQPFVGGKPGTGSIHGFHLVQEVTGQPAVFLQEVLPVAPVVPAGSEVSGHP